MNLRNATCAAGILFLLSPAAWAQVPTATAAADEEAAREAALFGGGDDEADREAALFGDAPGGPSTPDREAALFGGAGTATATPSATPYAEPPSAEARLMDALRDKNDFLDIGGVLWLWLQASDVEGTPLGQSTLSSPSFADVYLDARPTDRLRAYTRGRLYYDPTIDPTAVGLTGATQSQTRVQLDQLWLKFDVLRKVFITAGKQRIRWGTGRIWNPTDFLNPTRRDSLNFLDTRLGVPLVKVHVPVESLGWNFYAIAELNQVRSLEQLGGAFRAEVLLGTAEVALSTAVRKDSPWRFGADISLPIWDFDVHAEAALLHKVRTPFFDANSDASFINDLTAISDLETAQRVLAALAGQPVDRREDWIPQIVAGLDYTLHYNDQDNLIFAAEYFYNDAGTDLPGTYLPMLVNGVFQPLYVGRHYVSLAAYLVAPGDWDDTTFALVGLANLSDQTGLIRFNYTVKVLTYLTVNAFVAGFVGQAGGEYRLKARIPPVEPADDRLALHHLRT
ncbi:MAG: hypothetical protein H6730_14970 [Deltaproteobacteria bacterium]|nr:hypothetical protein [Deltaproteobacteria bacterium]